MIDERRCRRPHVGLDRAEPRRPVRGRALWVIFGSLLLVGGFWWGDVQRRRVARPRGTHGALHRAAAASDPTARRQRQRSRTIVGTDTDVINVEAEVSMDCATPGSATRSSARRSVRGSCPLVGSMWCRVTYRVEVPREFDVEVDVDDDRVDISNIDGDIVINSNNGAVDLADLSGAIEVEGDNGRIVGTDLSSTVVAAEADNGRIELAFVVPPDAVTVNGDNGSIDVAVPDVDIGL